jgi:hypothetical protein
MDLGVDMLMGAPGAAAYARAAARLTEAHNHLQRLGGPPAQIRALGAMAELFHTLAEARRARDEADRRLAEEALETPDELLAGRRSCDVMLLRPADPGHA